MEKQKILVVDDEEVLCDVLKFNLEVEGFKVDTAESAEQALLMPLTQYDLILLDVMMGEMSGFQMAQVLKDNPQTASIPLIFCTAKDSENDTVAGLTLGADDYISKPFSVREVVARVKTVLRRTRKTPVEPQTEVHSLTFGELSVDLDKKQCLLHGEPVALTKKELEVLVFLLERPGYIFSRDEILDKVWSGDVVVVDRTVDVTITRLRKKIEEYGTHVVTRHGYGYGFEI